MPKSLLEQIRHAVQTAPHISYAKKAEIFKLLNQLEDEMRQSQQQDPQTVHSTELKKSVAEFEIDHPDLVDLTNRACKMLSDIGI